MLLDQCQVVPDLLGYVELALRGGFPDAALRLSAGARRTWLEGYLDQLFTRDVASLEETRDPDRMRRYFEALALNSAPTRRDAHHLEWLRDQLGERFFAGAVLHTGPRRFRLAERIFAVPIATLWA